MKALTSVQISNQTEIVLLSYKFKNRSEVTTYGVTTSSLFHSFCFSDKLQSWTSLRYSTTQQESRFFLQTCMQSSFHLSNIQNYCVLQLQYFLLIDIWTTTFSLYRWWLIQMKWPKGPPPRNFPWFAGFKNAGGKSNYIIFMEQKVPCKISSFSKALALWFSVHYTFNLEYCKQIKDVVLFFQEYVFGLPDRSKKSATYLTVCSDRVMYCDVFSFCCV